MNMSSTVRIGFMPEPIPADKKMAGDATSPEEARLREACQGFEAIITRRLFAAMRDTTGEGGIFGKSFAKEMYESMQDDILATRIARSEHGGLADVLYRQLSGQLSAKAAPVPGTYSVNQITDAQVHKDRPAINEVA